MAHKPCIQKRLIRQSMNHLYDFFCQCIRFWLTFFFISKPLKKEKSLFLSAHVTFSWNQRTGNLQCLHVPPNHRKLSRQQSASVFPKMYKNTHTHTHSLAQGESENFVKKVNLMAVASDKSHGPPRGNVPGLWPARTGLGTSSKRSKR